MSKLTLEDTTQTALMKMSEGNPGALTVLLQVIEQAERIDPDSLGGSAMVLLHLDEMGIHGPKVWMLYKDVCKQNLSHMMGALRAVQMGIISRETLDKAIESYGQGLDLPAALAAVKAKLPRFQMDEADAVTQEG